MPDHITASLTLVQDPQELASSAASGAGDGLQQSAREMADISREAVRQAAQEMRQAAQQAREQAQQARQQAQQAEDQAQQLAREARQQPPAPPEPPAPPSAADIVVPGRITIQKEDGQVITLEGGAQAPTTAGTTQPIIYDGPPPGLVENVTGILFGAVAGITGMILVYRLLMKWLDNRGKRYQQLPDDTSQRLMRMEATIDSMAVEIERISEGQRFTSRLLADRTPVEIPRG